MSENNNNGAMGESARDSEMSNGTKHVEEGKANIKTID